MAVFAFLTVFAFVAVVVLVTAETVGWQLLFLFLVLLQELGCVATRARGFLMLAK